MIQKRQILIVFCLENMLLNILYPFLATLPSK